MSENIKIVSYYDYCKTCKYYKKDEKDEPCNTCLRSPTQEASSKPMCYKKGLFKNGKDSRKDKER